MKKFIVFAAVLALMAIGCKKDNTTPVNSTLSSASKMPKIAQDSSGSQPDPSKPPH